MKKSIGAKPLLFPAPVLLVGTYDEEERPNVMTCSWAGICCSDPPCIAVSLREATYSYDNLERTGAFTVSVPTVEQVKQADWIGMHSGRTENKFEALGLTATAAGKTLAPYVEECPLVLECKLLHTLKLGLHTLFVGQVVDTKADEAILEGQGRVSMTALQPLLFDPAGYAYWGAGTIVGPAFSIGAKP